VSVMRVVSFRGREDKLVLLGNIFSGYLQGSVLDVGCDQRQLSPMVSGRYVGIDISGTPDLVVNVEHGLPFKDGSFDTVIAFDVLEHLDKIHYVFDELCRVARRYVIIGLPNMYEWRFRVMFLLGKRLSGKYGLPIEPPQDRHRWLFSLKEAQSFVRERALRCGFEVCEEVVGYYNYKRLCLRILTMVGRSLGKAGINLFAYHYSAVLRRNEMIKNSCRKSGDNGL